MIRHLDLSKSNWELYLLFSSCGIKMVFNSGDILALPLPESIILKKIVEMGLERDVFK